MPESLAHTTVVNYRSRLKLLKEVLDKLSPSEQEKAKVEIATLEVKLGPLAQAERKPGRPKTKTEVPEELKPKSERTATSYWSEEAKTERLKAKMAKLKASLIETEGELSERVTTKSEADKAWEGIEGLINEEKAQEGVEGTERRDGRTGQESERGTSEERRTKG